MHQYIANRIHECHLHARKDAEKVQIVIILGSWGCFSILPYRSRPFLPGSVQWDPSNNRMFLAVTGGFATAKRFVEAHWVTGGHDYWEIIHTEFEIKQLRVEWSYYLTTDPHSIVVSTTDLKEESQMARTHFHWEDHVWLQWWPFRVSYFQTSNLSHLPNSECQKQQQQQQQQRLVACGKIRIPFSSTAGDDKKNPSCRVISRCDSPIDPAEQISVLKRFFRQNLPQAISVQRISKNHPQGFLLSYCWTPSTHHPPSLIMLYPQEYPVTRGEMPECHRRIHHQFLGRS